MVSVEQIIRLIEAIWKPLAVLGGIIFVLTQREGLTSVLKRGFRLKKGDTEFVSQEPEIPEEDEEALVQQGSREDEPGTDVSSPGDVDLDEPEEVRFGDIIAHLESGDFDQARQLYEDMRSGQDGEEARLILDARFNYAASRLSDDPAHFEELRGLVSRDNCPIQVFLFLARRLSELGEFSEALDVIEDALSQAESGEHRAYVLAQRAGVWREHENLDRAIEDLKEAIDEISEPRQLTILYRQLADVYDERGNPDLKLAALRKAARHSPGDDSLQFSLAYALGEAGYQKGAVSIYERLINEDPDHALAQNNAGTHWINFDAPIRGVTRLKKSADLGQTLALANLAFELIGQGFVEEANDLLEEARSYDDVHARVTQAEAAIYDRREGERTQVERIQRVGKQEIDVLDEFGDAYFESSQGTPDLSGRWVMNGDVEVTIEQQDDDLEARWKSHYSKGIGFEGTLSGRTSFVDLIERYWRSGDEGFEAGIRHGAIGILAGRGRDSGHSSNDKVPVEKGRVRGSLGSPTSVGFVHKPATDRDQYIPILDQTRTSAGPMVVDRVIPVHPPPPPGNR